MHPMLTALKAKATLNYKKCKGKKSSECIYSRLFAPLFPPAFLLSSFLGYYWGWDWASPKGKLVTAGAVAPNTGFSVTSTAALGQDTWMLRRDAPGRESGGGSKASCRSCSLCWSCRQMAAYWRKNKARISADARGTPESPSSPAISSGSANRAGRKKRAFHLTPSPNVPSL